MSGSRGMRTKPEDDDEAPAYSKTNSSRESCCCRQTSSKELLYVSLQSIAQATNLRQLGQQLKSQRLQIAAQLRHRLHPDCVDSQCSRCFDIDLAIVQKKSLIRGNTEAAERMLVDRRVRLDLSHFRREGHKIKIVDPFELIAAMRDHLLMHVRKKTGLQTGRAELVDPVDHVVVDVAPHSHVEGTNLLQFLCADLGSHVVRQHRPIFFRRQIAAIKG